MESTQRLDNTRTHRNNLTNALSSLSASVSAGTGQERLLGNTGSYHLPPASSESAVEGGEEMKVKEKFQNNSGDNELNKDYKKRRPLTVLKSHNAQCLPNSHSSSSPVTGASSLAPNAPFIPSDHSCQDVKQLNGYKYVASTKCTTKACCGPAISTEQPQLDADLVKRETKSHKKTSDEGSAPKGKLKQHSKRKTGSSSPVAAETQAPVETIAPKEHLVGSKRLSETETTDHRPLSNAASPSCASSRRSKKQNKHKEAAYVKIPQHVDSPCRELKEIVDNVSPDLADVTQKTFSKLRSSVEEQAVGRISTMQKDKKLEPMKSSSVWPGGYTSTSGVAELDTFEVTSVRNQKLATKRSTPDKRPADKVSSFNEVNSLDTFDEPVPRPSTLRSVQASSSSAVQKERDVDEKWIEVNRKVKRVMVPSGVVSHILGANGSKLEAICQVTRAHIELEKTSNPNETVFVLRGTLEQMQAASSMISALMKDYKSSDGAKTGNIPQPKNGLPMQPLLQAVSAKPVTVTTSREMKTSVKLGQSPVPSVTNNATVEKCSPPVPQINGYGQNDEEYPDSVQSSVSEQSDSCSERCSPAQDLLIGEYSLFEHGLGQPLEKLLARKDSSKQTFARAAAIRMPSRTLTPIIPNHSAIDQVLLAKAPGYRNAKAIYGRDACFPKAAGLASRVPNGRLGWPAFSGRGPERLKENEPSRCTASHLFGIGSSNVHIPPVERPMSAPGFPSAHSSSSSAAVPGAVDRLATPPDHVVAMQTFSNLNPNAPDFVFTLPLEEASSRVSRVPEQCGPHLDGVPANPSADNSGCIHANGSTGEFSYSMSQLGSGFESLSVELRDSTPGGGVGRDVGFALPGSDEGMYAPTLGGDNLSTPWLCSQESWHPSKMSYVGVGRGEQVMPGTAATAPFPSRGELYRNYFAHPPFSPITSSPYNCAFYQQQNMMLAPVQSWSHGAQTLAQAGP